MNLQQLPLLVLLLIVWPGAITGAPVLEPATVSSGWALRGSEPRIGGADSGVSEHARNVVVDVRADNVSF